MIENLIPLFRLFLITFVCTLLITGIFFIIRARKIKEKDFTIVGIGYVMFTLTTASSLILNVAEATVIIFSLIGTILIMIFTHLMFHKERKSSFPKLIMVASVIMGIFAWVMYQLNLTPLNSHELYLAQSILDFIFRSMVFDWLAWSAYSAHKKLKDQDIEPWLKTRYKMIYISSPLLTFIWVLRIFQPWPVQFGDSINPQSLIIFGISSILALIYTITFALAWIMPNKFKNYLNRGYTPVKEKKMVEEEIMSEFMTLKEG